MSNLSQFTLNDLAKYIAEEEEEVTPADVSSAENVADAPVQSDDTIEITFGDLKDEVQGRVKDLLMKEMNATDEFSEKNLQTKLDAYSIFQGTVKEFKNILGVENK